MPEVEPPGDEPAVVSSPLVGERSTTIIVQPEAADDEETTLLTPPAPGPAADDEPTVEALPRTVRSPEETAAARPPEAGPRTVRAPEDTGDVRPPEAGPRTVRPPEGTAAARPHEEATGRPHGDGETVRLTPPAVVPGAGGAEGETAAESDSGLAGGEPEHGSPEPVNAGEAAVTVPSSEVARVPKKDLEVATPWKRWSSAGALIWVLLALFGFTLVVQLRSNNADDGLASARQEDLVRILSDLEARDTRLQAEIATLEQSQRQLTSGVEGRQAALADAEKRADELGLLAGTLPGRGPGLRIVIDPKGQVKASAILNAVQELRGAGGEVMQINGSGGGAVRIVASTYFVDADGGGIVADGVRLVGPYTLWVIGSPQTMQPALQIPGGVVESVKGDGGSVTMEVRTLVEVTAVHRTSGLQYARPVS
jgi:uncharacterized protein YlxW (UPF0749 family)